MPSRPASGEVFTWKFIVMVGSSTLTDNRRDLWPTADVATGEGALWVRIGERLLRFQPH